MIIIIFTSLSSIEIITFRCDCKKLVYNKFHIFTREEMISYTWRVKELEWKGKKKNAVAEKN